MVFVEIKRTADEKKREFGGLFEERDRAERLLRENGEKEQRSRLWKLIFRDNRERLVRLDAVGTVKVSDTAAETAKVIMTTYEDPNGRMEDIYFRVYFLGEERTYNLGERMDLLDRTWSFEGGERREGVDFATELNEILDFVEGVVGGGGVMPVAVVREGGVGSG